MKVTIDVVAKKAGVSKTTVSRILNGNYAHMTEQTKNRVLEVMRELDYRPNALAQGLKSMRTDVIGIVLSNLKNPFWSTVLEGVEDVCRESGYNLMICNSNEDMAVEEQYIREFQMRRLDGIVINPTVRNMDMYERLVQEKFPLVVMNRRIPGLKAHHVAVNNVEGASMAVRTLLANGKSKIAIAVYENSYVSTWKDRMEGYRKELLAAGFNERDLRIIELEPNSQSVKDDVLRYLRNNPDIDGIFSTNNMITLEVMDAVKELGWRIPHDVAIIGYDETVWSKHLNPPLTTISQPGYQMGREAARLLIETILANKEMEPQTVILEPELIVRQSCGGEF